MGGDRHLMLLYSYKLFSRVFLCLKCVPLRSLPHVLEEFYANGGSTLDSAGWPAWFHQDAWSPVLVTLIFSSMLFRIVVWRTWKVLLFVFGLFVCVFFYCFCEFFLWFSMSSGLGWGWDPAANPFSLSGEQTSSPLAGLVLRGFILIACCPVLPMLL